METAELPKPTCDQLTAAPSEKALQRAQRSLLAERLLAHTEYLDQVIEWRDIDSLPAWCTLHNEQLHNLMLTCGTICYADQMQMVLDGSLLNAFTNLPGAQTALNFDRSGIPPLPLPLVDQLDDHRLSAGATVLIATLENHVCQKALEKLLDTSLMTERPDKELALEIVVYATKILETEPASTSNENIRMDVDVA